MSRIVFRCLLYDQSQGQISELLQINRTCWKLCKELGRGWVGGNYTWLQVEYLIPWCEDWHLVSHSEVFGRDFDSGALRMNMLITLHEYSTNTETANLSLYHLHWSVQYKAAEWNIYTVYSIVSYLFAQNIHSLHEAARHEAMVSGQVHGLLQGDGQGAPAQHMFQVKGILLW